jgi:hypothetical protein
MDDGMPGADASSAGDGGEAGATTAVDDGVDDGVDGGDDGPMAPPPTSGMFLLAIDTVINPGLPLQYRVETKATVTDIELVLQPLSLNQGETILPREPVGEALVASAIPVVDGAFEIDLGEVMIPGEANPITGSDIVAEVVLHGMFVSPDAYCGTVTGTVIAPIQAPLDGSTFGAQIVEPDLVGEDLPAPIGACSPP